jgi:hypothetical protein
MRQSPYKYQQLSTCSTTVFACRAILNQENPLILSRNSKTNSFKREQNIIIIIIYCLCYMEWNLESYDIEAKYSRLLICSRRIFRVADYPRTSFRELTGVVSLKKASSIWNFFLKSKNYKTRGFLFRVLWVSFWMCKYGTGVPQNQYSCFYQESFSKIQAYMYVSFYKFRFTTFLHILFTDYPGFPIIRGN